MPTTATFQGLFWAALKFLGLAPLCRSLSKVSSARVHWVETSRGDKIITAFIPYLDGRGGSQGRLTLLYSHGNAADLGQMLPVFK